MNKNRVIEITPPGTRTDVDSIVVRDEGDKAGWNRVLAEVEMALDNQWSAMSDGEKSWSDIGVNVQCKEMTDEELEELEE